MKLDSRKLIEKAVNFLLNILIFIFGAILLISIYTGVQTKILGNDYADFFGYSIFEVQTGSMAEAIEAGDWIVVKQTKKVKLDDVITYKLDGEYITHRVMEVYNGTYITKGDANPAKDDPVDQTQIVGKVVKILPNFGFIRRTIFNPSVLITLIITLFLFNLAFTKTKEKDTKKVAKIKKSDDGFGYMLINFLIKKTKIILEDLIDKAKVLVEDIKKKTDVKSKAKVKQPKPNRNISIDNELFMKYEQMYKSDKSDEDEYDDEELEKTSVYRVVSVDDADVSEKFKNLVRQIDKDEYKEEVETDEEEDELEKTSVYRVISVDDADVSEKYKEEVQEKEKDKEEDNDIEEELSKTSVYRVISVDASEVNNTLLEIAQNELKKTEAEEKNKTTKAEAVEEKSEFEDDDTLTKVNLDLLKSKKGLKGNKNIIDTAMFIKEEEINELTDILFNDEKIRFNKETIKDEFTKCFINARYYNYYGNTDGKNKKFSMSRFEKYIEANVNELIDNYHNKTDEYKKVVDYYAKGFVLIAKLDQAKDSISDLKAKKEFYKKEIIKYNEDLNNERIDDIINGVIKIQRNYTNMLDYFLKSLDTNSFELKFNKLSTKKNMFGLELDHNISFSRVYSDYIIDKTYTEGIVAEDKIPVTLSLLSVQIINDMLAYEYDKKYLLYITPSLYGKEKKFKSILKMFDDIHAKNSIIILLKLEDLLSNKKVIKQARKEGYKFALVFDKEISITQRDKANIYVADYIFVSKDVDVMLNVLSFIPEELADNVIYENVIEKIGDFGGDA